MDNSIVPAHLAVKAMRDNGYKNAAYALAELIDNSIQHGATSIELLCSEIDVQLRMNNVSRINQIAVLDNGSGMNIDVLRMALQFGNETHLDVINQKGIGKFGMGLPSSSISQAKRVEVWTWQKGIDSAIYSYLDIDKIIIKEIKEVPIPIKKEVPQVWKDAGKSFGRSGTLVVWSKIDRCIWKTASAIIENSELLIGRMYRKFIENGKVVINMVAFNEATPKSPSISRNARPNDPIYLMKNTSCPVPFSEKPMFEKWGDEAFEIPYEIKYNNENHRVVLRFTIAKREAREGYNPGDKPHGKHAKSNIGVSVVRAGRELDLDQAWVIQYDTRERWWGVEIEFPPTLDEIFGVTNNKQFAHNFSELGKIDLDELLKNGKSFAQLREELEEEGDPKAFLIEIAQKINTQLSNIRNVLKAQMKDEDRGKQRHISKTSPEFIATEATKERVEQGHMGTSDKQENKAESLRRAEVTQALELEGVSNPTELVDWLFKNNLKYSFIDADFESSAFFSVKSKGGKIIISLNTNHPAYQKLVEVLEDRTEGLSNKELESRLKNASEGLKLLLMAWARYEDEQPDGKLKTIAQESRQDWGRIARQFLQED